MDPIDHPIRLPEVLTDGVIVLDAPTLDDAGPHLAGEDEEMRRRFESPGPGTLEGARAAMGRWITARAAGGPMFAYALRNLTGALMGGCEIRLVSADVANVSYWLFPAFRGRGHASRALRLLCEHAAFIPGLCRIEAHVDPDNIASRRVAEQARFLEVGVVEDATADGSIASRILYVRPRLSDKEPE